MADSHKSFSLGARLRRLREEHGKTENDLARETKMPPEYIAALERGDFHVLSARVYARGFLKKILEALDVEDAKEWCALLDREWNTDMDMVSKKSLVKHSGQTVHAAYLRERRITWVSAGCAGLLLCAFIGFQLIQFFNAPRLALFEPKNNSSFSERLIRAQGEAERESQLTVNGYELTIDESGEFEESIVLLPGVNELVFRLEDRFGKVTEITRHVLVE